MSVYVIAEFPVHPEQIDAFLAALHESLAATRGFEGCEGVDAFVDVDRPGRVVLWERWPTKEHHRAYLAWRKESGSALNLVPFLNDKLRFTYLEPQPAV